MLMGFLKDLCVGQVIIHKDVKALVITDFTAGHFRPDRQSVSVGNEMDLSREATF